jgi:enamine deaminase RidA (YjgF/YER057c/UK114 family)
MTAPGAPGAAGPAAGRRPTPHRVVNPEGMAPPVGFAHAVVAAPGRTVYLGGQAAQGPDGTIVGATLAEQFEVAAANLVAALAAAGGGPEHLVSLHVYTTEAAGYRAVLSELAASYQRHLGRHYVATALFEVAGLFDPAAKVELVGVAVVPDQDRREQP